MKRSRALSLLSVVTVLATFSGIVQAGCTFNIEGDDCEGLTTEINCANETECTINLQHLQQEKKKYVGCKVTFNCETPQLLKQDHNKSEKAEDLI